MSGSLEQPSNLRPSYRRDQESIWLEIRKLQRGVHKRGQTTTEDVPFVLSGKIYVSRSPRYYVHKGGTLWQVLVSLDTPGTTETTVTLYKNTDVLTTITLAAGADKTTKIVNEAFARDTDYLVVAVTTAGVDAVGIDAQCRFKKGG